MLKYALVNGTNALEGGKWGVHATSRDVMPGAERTCPLWAWGSRVLRLSFPSRSYNLCCFQSEAGDLGQWDVNNEVSPVQSVKKELLHA